MTRPEDIRRKLAARLARAHKAQGDELDFLSEFAADELVARLSGVNRHFEQVVDVCSIWRETPAILHRALRGATFHRISTPETFETLEGSPEFDLAVSAYGLHWASDLGVTLHAIRGLLRPDALFVGVLPARGTLEELRMSLLAAEASQGSGAAMRVDRFPELSEAGAFLHKAGFALPVADLERLHLRYGSVGQLIGDLRSVGAAGTAHVTETMLPRDILARLATEYLREYADPDGRIRVSVNLIFLTGWAPHESQQKPLRPGTARQSLAAALKRKQESP